MALRIAVTGGIGEGKSTVMGYLRELGLETVSSDVVAREVFNRPGVQQAIAGFLGESGMVAPAKVREAIAEKPEFRRKLNGLMHPLILKELRSATRPYAEVPLLIEACLQREYDRIWVVTCGEAEQLRRLTQRLGDEASARRLIGTQLPTRVKLAFADAVIRTNGPEENVKSFVAKLVRTFASA